MYMKRNNKRINSSAIKARFNNRKVKKTRVEQFTLEFTVGTKTLYAIFGTGNPVYSPPAPPNNNDGVTGINPATHVAFYDGNDNYFTIVNDLLIKGNSVTLNLMIQGSGDSVNISVSGKPKDGSVNVEGLGDVQLEYGIAMHTVTVSRKSNEVTQIIDLQSGWNLMSFYIDTTESLLNVNEFGIPIGGILNNLVSSGNLIKVLNEQGSTIESFDGFWVNAIGLHSNSEGYYIKMAASASFDLTGSIIQTPLEIDLLKGWNIISFPLNSSSSSLEINESGIPTAGLLNNLVKSNNLIKVLNEQGSTIESFGGFWINAIGDFMPGEAYYIKVSEDTTLIYN